MFLMIYRAITTLPPTLEIVMVGFPHFYGFNYISILGTVHT